MELVTVHPRVPRTREGAWLHPEKHSACICNYGVMGWFGWISHFSVAIMKHSEQRLFINERFKGKVYLGAYSSDGRVHSRTKTAGNQSRKLRDHIFNHKPKQRKQTASRARLKALKTHAQCHASFSKAKASKGSITSVNSAANWGPSIQIHEPMGPCLIQNITMVIAIKHY